MLAAVLAYNPRRKDNPAVNHDHQRPKNWIYQPWLPESTR